MIGSPDLYFSLAYWQNSDNSEIDKSEGVNLLVRISFTNFVFIVNYIT